LCKPRSGGSARARYSHAEAGIRNDLIDAGAHRGHFEILGRSGNASILLEKRTGGIGAGDDVPTELRTGIRDVEVAASWGGPEGKTLTAHSGTICLREQAKAAGTASIDAQTTVKVLDRHHRSGGLGLNGRSPANHHESK